MSTTKLLGMFRAGEPLEAIHQYTVSNPVLNTVTKTLAAAASSSAQLNKNVTSTQSACLA